MDNKKKKKKIRNTYEEWKKYILLIFMINIEPKILLELILPPLKAP